MTHTDQQTQSGAPPGGRPRTHPVSLRTVLGSAIAVTAVAGAAVLGVGTLASDDQTEAAGHPPIAGQDLTDTSGAPSTSAIARVTEVPASAWSSTGRTPTCSIWSVPTLEVAPVPQSSLTEGVPYVAVCTGDADEETMFVFLYGHDNHTPAPRR
jgi:hypothetical protein